MLGKEPKVGVVIPVFNAERWLAATLNGVVNQTYRALDIIIVNDGSTDASAAIAAACAAMDPRVRIVHQQNAGVAAARNLGAFSTNAEYLAFVDADDLWAPAKIALQMQKLQQGGNSVGLVYCWFAHIDEDGRVIFFTRPATEGNVLQPLCRTNFIGNGSSPLMRRAAFDAAGGFDSALRECNAQGCEDVLLYLKIAEKFEFRVVPQDLVGYRMTNSSMSADVMQMLRSCELVLAKYRKKYPEFRNDLDAHLKDTLDWLLIRALDSGQLLKASRLLRMLLICDPHSTISRLPVLARYSTAALVPRWFKLRLRKILKQKAARPLYTEFCSPV
jgi:glycosyltransferase involved in cell wall biosynthesis